MTAIIAVLLTLVGLVGTAVVFTGEPARQAVTLSAFGLTMAALFMALQAPDVAFSELAVGTVALPLLFLVVLASTRIDRRPGRPERQ
jgi:uncharacterized MnhB-related membrane protein